MIIRIYKGYEIVAIPEQLDDNAGWSVTVCIYAHNGPHISGRVFKPPEIQINQREAILYGLIMAQRTIDGAVEGFSIDDL